MKLEIITISCIFFTTAFLIGHLVNCLCFNKNQGVLLNIFTGILTIWGLLELLIVPMTFAKIPFSTLTLVYGIFLCTGCAASLFFWKRMGQIIYHALANWKKYISWTIIIAVFIILFQLYFVHHYTYHESDDAYYVNIANEAINSNIIFGVNAETGIGTKFSYRYVFSLWPIFYALLGQWFQIPPTIIAHTVLPFIIIPYAYLVYMLMGRSLFPGNKELQGYFLIFAAVLHMFLPNIHMVGGSYLLLAPWMGKAILASISMPAAVYFMLRLTKESCSIGDWIIFLIFTLSCCLHSSMSIFFIPVITCSLSLIWDLKIKKPAFFINTLLGCSPCILLGVCYLLFK